MKKYTLWNRKEQRAFRWPANEIWTIDSKEEAQQSLNDLFQYLEETGLEHLESNFMVLEAEKAQSLMTSSSQS